MDYLGMIEVGAYTRDTAGRVGGVVMRCTCGSWVTGFPDERPLAADSNELDWVMRTTLGHMVALAQSHVRKSHTEAPIEARDVDPLGKGVGGAPAPSGCPGCPGPGVPHQHYATGGLDALHAEQARQAARGDEVMPRPWSAIVADDDAWKSDDASARGVSGVGGAPAVREGGGGVACGWRGPDVDARNGRHGPGDPEACGRPIEWRGGRWRHVDDVDDHPVRVGVSTR